MSKTLGVPPLVISGRPLMVMPCATISSRTSATGGPWLLAPSPDTSTTRFRPRKLLSANRSPANCRALEIEVRRALFGGLARELLDEGLRIGGRRNHRPRHDDVLRGLSGPFDIGDGDPAVDAVLDRLDDALMRQRCGVALALDLQLDPATSKARRRRPGSSSTSTGSAASAGRRPRGRAPQMPRAVSPRRRKAGTTMKAG